MRARLHRARRHSVSFRVVPEVISGPNADTNFIAYISRLTLPSLPSRHAAIIDIAQMCIIRERGARARLLTTFSGRGKARY